MESVFNLEMAQALVNYLKTVSEEDSVLLDTLEIKLDEDNYKGFGYFPELHCVVITEELLDTEQDKFIIDYVNEKYNLNLRNTPLTRALHAVFHEIGHSLDLGALTKEQFKQRLMNYQDYDFEIKFRTNIISNEIQRVSWDMQDLIKSAENHDITMEQYVARMAKLSESFVELNNKKKQADYDYRLNPSEKIADDYAAKFLLLLRPIIPQLFKEQEHLITRKKEA